MPSYQRAGRSTQLKRLKRSKGILRHRITSGLTVAQKPYIYDTLPAARQSRYKLRSQDHIRVLILFPGVGTEPLRGSLITTSISEGVPYEALSYAWGDPTFSAELICDGKSLRITESVKCALFRLRYLQHVRYLWIDGICIDQQNLHERAHQVKLMQKVYSKAERVLVWLGDADEENELALDMVLWFAEKEEKGIEGAELASEVFKHYSEVEGAARLGRKHLMALEALLECSWSRRIWVLQEIALARDALILYGSRWLDWLTFQKAIVAMASAVIPGGFPVGCFRWFNVAILCHKRGPILTPRKILDFTSGHQFTDPRDRIYALLGLLDPAFVEKTVVDYALSPEDVLRAFTIEVIRYEQNLDFLVARQSPSKSVETQRGVNKPSWVFDWLNGHPETHPCGIYFSASNGQPLYLDVSETDSVLRLEGKLIDKVRILDKVQGRCMEVHALSARVKSSVSVASSSSPLAPFVTPSFSTFQKKFLQTISGGKMSDEEVETTLSDPYGGESVLQQTSRSLETLLGDDHDKFDYSCDDLSDLKYRHFCVTSRRHFGLVPLVEPFGCGSANQSGLFYLSILYLPGRLSSYMVLPEHLGWPASERKECIRRYETRIVVYMSCSGGMNGKTRLTCIDCCL